MPTSPTCVAAFEDPRYVRIGGRPVHVHLPARRPARAGPVRRAVAEDGPRRRARGAVPGGVPRRARATWDQLPVPVRDGFDAAVYFQFPFGRDVTTRARERMLARGLVHGPMRYPYRRRAGRPPARRRAAACSPASTQLGQHPPLGRRGLVATGSTPERFGRHVRRAVELASANPVGEQVVMIKSWNEWAEGNYLEPDAEFGRGTARGPGRRALAPSVARARRSSIGRAPSGRCPRSR